MDKRVQGPIDPYAKPKGPQRIQDPEFPTEEELEDNEVLRAGGAGIALYTHVYWGGLSGEGARGAGHDR